MLLNELGFLTVLVAPIRILRLGSKSNYFKKGGVPHLPHDNVSLFLVKWLAFRLVFASGVVKLTSECPTWWGLTGIIGRLYFHFDAILLALPIRDDKN